MASWFSTLLTARSTVDEMLVEILRIRLMMVPLFDRCCIRLEIGIKFCNQHRFRQVSGTKGVIICYFLENYGYFCSHH